MIPKAIREISSGGSRRASFSGTSEPSTRNMGGRPAFRWMSEALPRRATCRISLSSIAPPTSNRGSETLAFHPDEKEGLTGLLQPPSAQFEGDVALLDPPSAEIEGGLVERRQMLRRKWALEDQGLPLCRRVEADDLDRFIDRVDQPDVLDA